MKKPGRSPYTGWLAALCALALLLSLCACVKKDGTPSDAATVQRKLADQHAETALYTGADAPDSPEAAKARTRLVFRNDAARWHGVFYEFAADADAAECFDALSAAREVTYSRDAGGNLKILEYTLETDGTREDWRVTCVGPTILAVAYPEGDDAAKSAAGKLRVALGY